MCLHRDECQRHAQGVHLSLLRSVVVVDPAAIEEEAERAHLDAGPVRIGLLQLAHAGSVLHSEVDLVRVLNRLS